MSYLVIYDSECNLCSGLVQLLEGWDRGEQFRYLPMQDQAALTRLGIQPEQCELGVILVDRSDPMRRWQGSAAAEEIARLLPLGEALIELYRGIPGLKALGDRGYEQVRDHRYDWFGRREQPYRAQMSAEICSSCRQPGLSEISAETASPES